MKYRIEWSCVAVAVDMLLWHGHLQAALVFNVFNVEDKVHRPYVLAVEVWVNGSRK